MNGIEAAGWLLGAIAAGLALHAVVFFFLRRAVARDPVPIERSLVANIESPSRLVLPLAALEIALGGVSLSDPAGTILVHAVGICLVMGISWLVVRATFVLDDLLLSRFRLDSEDNLRARRVHTQVQVLRRVTVVVVSVVALAIVLLSFPEVRAAGAGLLASAGLAGLMVGVAARPTATNVVAGIQIALTQPIRVDDVVVVEGEWGRIEEIGLTYVVVRIWDLRRLVLPISYFVEQPFENWTRSTADILGWVMVDLDYRAPVDDIREAFQAILRDSPDWDGKVQVLQVTSLGSETMQVRCLMSSPDSARSWNLQCEVREKLIRYVRESCPWALPRLRTEAVGAADVRPREPEGR